MTLLDLVWLFLAWLVSVAAVLRWYHVHRWPEPGEALPPTRERIVRPGAKQTPWRAIP